MTIEDIRKKHEGFCRTTGKGALSCLNNYDVDRLFAELDEAHKKAMDMLHGNFTQCCSYCGWEAPPPNGWEELQGHIKVCPQHPLRQAEAALDEARGKTKKPKVCRLCGKTLKKSHKYINVGNGEVEHRSCISPISYPFMGPLRKETDHEA